MNIRQAVPSDAEALFQVQRDSASAAYQAIFPPEKYPFPVDLERQRWQEYLDSEESAVLVAEREGHILGMVVVTGETLERLFVGPLSWGLGVGSHLHDEALALLRRRGRRECNLQVLEANHKARRFYERRGWVLDGRRSESPFPPYPVTLGYRRDLSGPAKAEYDAVPELMKLHVQALYTHDEGGRITFVNEPGRGDKPAPRFFLGRTPGGHVWRFRSDVPGDVVARLEALCAQEPTRQDLPQRPVHDAEYIRILESHAPVQQVSCGPAYRFPDTLHPASGRSIAVTEENVHVLRSGLEAWIEDVPHCRPFYVALHENQAVAVCCSVRITPEAHEAGVETLSSYRRQGYARDVVEHWAAAVRAMGCRPLYSTSWENTASQGVARSLGLVQYGVDYSVD